MGSALVLSWLLLAPSVLAASTSATQPPVNVNGVVPAAQGSLPTTSVTPEAAPAAASSAPSPAQTATPAIETPALPTEVQPAVDDFLTLPDPDPLQDVVDEVQSLLNQLGLPVVAAGVAVVVLTIAGSLLGAGASAGAAAGAAAVTVEGAAAAPLASAAPAKEVGWFRRLLYLLHSLLLRR